MPAITHLTTPIQFDRLEVEEIVRTFPDFQKADDGVNQAYQTLQMALEKKGCQFQKRLSLEEIVKTAREQSENYLCDALESSCKQKQQTRKRLRVQAKKIHMDRKSERSLKELQLETVQTRLNKETDYQKVLLGDIGQEDFTAEEENFLQEEELNASDYSQQLNSRDESEWEAICDDV